MTQLIGNLDKGLLFVLSAPAGTGKTTLVHRLTAEFPCVVASVSFTTRKPRRSEISGVHYNFVTEQEFENKVEAGDFLEHVKLYGDYYGTERDWVQNELVNGHHVILVIDTQGAAKLQKDTKATYIFIAPPSLEDLRLRLERRKTESPERIHERLRIAGNEIKASMQYDYRIINDDLEIAYHALKSVVVAEEHRVNYLKEL